MFYIPWLARLALLVGLVSVPTFSFAQMGAPGLWQISKAENGTRYLSYSSTSQLLGKPSRHTVTFFCNPVSTKTERGMLGIEVQVENVEALKAFQFEEFEGPDATTNGKKLFRISVNTPNTPPFVVDSLLSGWTPDSNKFAFGIAQESQRAKSNEKAVLLALAAEADSVQITINHPRDSKLKLEFFVPVSGQRNAFKTLLSGVK